MYMKKVLSTVEHITALIVHTLEMFIKLEVNCTHKTMITVLDEASHPHIQIIGPPDPPTATVLLSCVGQVPASNSSCGGDATAG